ncbi:hypothetical protein Q4527_13705 [Alteromonas stellipolaris]|uniref:Uncharacterized protein n=1 Tax=Alteromonas stellipolaris TaxID=233316 RepID=A0AAW7Z710_9ALTE|nr:hypothetical protein [Alteromonas stellipolaris]
MSFDSCELSQRSCRNEVVATKLSQRSCRNEVVAVKLSTQSRNHDLHAQLSLS